MTTRTATPPREPSRWLLDSPARVTAARLIRRRWRLTVRFAERVPLSGPVVVVGNHIGLLDGPMMAILGPRPVHALTKREMFRGALGRFLMVSGQIPVDREGTDVGAVRTAVRVLAAGGAVGMFPEGTRGAGTVETTRGGAAYLAMVGGAMVVPMAFLGSRLPGGSNNSLPPAGSPIVITYGEALAVEPVEWPRRRADVRRVADEIADALRTTLAEARAATGMELPGPLPRSEDAA